MKPGWIKALAAAGVVAAVGTAIWLSSGGGDSPAPTGSGEHVTLLEPLGKAYAQDYGFEFTSVATTVATTVTEADREEWVQKIVKALSLGYDPITKPFRAIPLEQMAEGSKVRMSRDRTPEQVVRECVLAGHTIVEATWHFGSAGMVKSYSILGARGQPLFDTLLSMPVVHGPVFEAAHF